jgi:hypothetical protein
MPLTLELEGGVGGGGELVERVEVGGGPAFVGDVEGELVGRGEIKFGGEDGIVEGVSGLVGAPAVVSINVLVGVRIERINVPEGEREDIPEDDIESSSLGEGVEDGDVLIEFRRVFIFEAKAGGERDGRGVVGLELDGELVDSRGLVEVVFSEGEACEVQVWALEDDEALVGRGEGFGEEDFGLWSWGGGSGRSGIASSARETRIYREA